MGRKSKGKAKRRRAESRSERTKKREMKRRGREKGIYFITTAILQTPGTMICKK